MLGFLPFLIFSMTAFFVIPSDRELPRSLVGPASTGLSILTAASIFLYVQVREGIEETYREAPSLSQDQRGALESYYGMIRSLFLVLFRADVCGLLALMIAVVATSYSSLSVAYTIVPRTLIVPYGLLLQSVSLGLFATLVLNLGYFIAYLVAYSRDYILNIVKVIRSAPASADLVAQPGPREAFEQALQAIEEEFSQTKIAFVKNSIDENEYNKKKQEIEAKMEELKKRMKVAVGG